MINYKIFPSIGVARLGNSKEFYVAPAKCGHLPRECDDKGNLKILKGYKEGDFNYQVYDGIQPVQQFKSDGKIKKQAALFEVFKCEDSNAHGDCEWKKVDPSEFKSMTWKVHVANKKAAWYDFNGLAGNSLFGKRNSYDKTGTKLRNNNEIDRKSLIIDFGPRELTFGTEVQKADISYVKGNNKGYYKPAEQNKFGNVVNSLGQIMINNSGDLLVIGPDGKSGGNKAITSFAGADTWHDDISDGSVTCTIKLQDDTEIKLDAWVIIGSPKYAPELVNVTTLGDTMFDVAVRYLNKYPEIYANKEWNRNYKVNYYNEIFPILRRLREYRWVAHIPTVGGLIEPFFPLTDNSEKNRKYRHNFLKYFRKPVTILESDDDNDSKYFDGTTNLDLFGEDGVPLQPDNAGTGSVKNNIIDKFATLTHTQYFMLEQWADGNFEIGDHPRKRKNPACGKLPKIHDRDFADVGNCVGLPFSPGIEVTWNVQNPQIYSDTLRIKHRTIINDQLSPDYDETQKESDGCEPGDLTKRMAIPWQADFMYCTVQNINFTDPNVNKENGVPKPPVVLSYWWPPQSPYNVFNGDFTAVEQEMVDDVDSIPGSSVRYQRGIFSGDANDIIMSNGWSNLGFILNRSKSRYRYEYSYFVESERNNASFEKVQVGICDVIDDQKIEDIISTTYVTKNPVKGRTISLKIPSYTEKYDQS